MNVRTKEELEKRIAELKAEIEESRKSISQSAGNLLTAVYMLSCSDIPPKTEELKALEQELQSLA